MIYKYLYKYRENHFSDPYKTEFLKIRFSELINRVKNFGYHYGTFAGVSVGIEDLEVPPKKKDLLNKADKEVAQIEKDYKSGKIINEERYRKILAPLALISVNASCPGVSINVILRHPYQKYS